MIMDSFDCEKFSSGRRMGGTCVPLEEQSISLGLKFFIWFASEAEFFRVCRARYIAHFWPLVRLISFDLGLASDPSHGNPRFAVHSLPEPVPVLLGPGRPRSFAHFWSTLMFHIPYAFNLIFFFWKYFTKIFWWSDWPSATRCQVGLIFWRLFFPIWIMIFLVFFG